MMMSQSLSSSEINHCLVLTDFPPCFLFLLVSSRSLSILTNYAFLFHTTSTPHDFVAIKSNNICWTQKTKKIHEGPSSSQTPHQEHVALKIAWIFVKLANCDRVSYDVPAKMKKQFTIKQDDAPLHLAVREGNLELVQEIISEVENDELINLLSKQNHLGETALYIAAENGYADIVKLMIKYYNVGMACIRARNGFDAFHVAAKQGHLDVLKVLMEAMPELSMTVDHSNTTALHTAASQGHNNVVNFLLDKVSSLVTIARSNGKTALHSAARHGHLEVVFTLLSRAPKIATRIDKKGQTALHMAIKGQNLGLVNELVRANPTLMNMIDNKGNTALHVAARKGHMQIVQKLLKYEGLATTTVNRAGETALDTAERAGHGEIVDIVKNYGVQSARFIKSTAIKTALEFKQTVTDIKDGVHNQLEHTRRTRKRVHKIAKRLNKMQVEGLNNAITSTTVVAVLIASVAFAAIFSVPGQYADNPEALSPGHSAGEANIAPTRGFMIFIVFDSIALFISLAVVVVQTSIVVIEKKAKKQMMAVINKLMWLACVFVSVAYVALSCIVVGNEKWLAIAVAIIGTVIMATTIGTMCYWVIVNRLQSSKLRSLRRSSMSSMSLTQSARIMSGSEDHYKTVYAI